MTPNSPGNPDHFRIIYHKEKARSSYRLIDMHSNEIIPANEFLDSMAIRGFSNQTLRTYAYALLSVWKWLRTGSLSIEELTGAHLVDYIRYLRENANAKTPPAPKSINLRLVVLRSLYRFHMASEFPKTQKTPHESFSFFAQSYRVGSNKPLPVKRPSIRVKEPERLIVPLTRREVVLFFESLRTWRDLAIASLMLFCGLRSREVLDILINNMNLAQKELCVRGKGNKYRMLPIASYAQSTIRSYLTLERPKTDHDILFVNLKGNTRGRPMTSQGLRGIFRYHRKRSGIEKANAHRFRHTFASDMVMSGVSLPVLMRLMGHSDIQMTMRYVNLSAEDVRQEFERAVRRQIENISDEKPFPPNP